MYEAALDGCQAAFAAAADDVLTGADDTIGGGIPADEIDGDIAAGEAIDEIQVDEHLAVVGFNLFGQGADAAHCAVEEEDDGAAGGEGALEAIVIFDGCDNGGIEQELGEGRI